MGGLTFAHYFLMIEFDMKNLMKIFVAIILFANSDSDLSAGCRSCEYRHYRSNRETPRFVRTSIDKKSQSQFIGNDISGTSNPGWNYSNINR